MHRAALVLAFLGACFSVPAFQSGILTCDQGECPPDMVCRPADNRCYFPGDVVGDGPIATDGRTTSTDGPLHVADGPTTVLDAPIVDAPISDASVPDAMVPCSTGAHRCAAGNLEICQSSVWVAAVPSCSDQGHECFDPAPPGGTDAYCGDCLKGAERCVANPSPTRQMCPTGTGVWTDISPACGTPLGCYDPDGDSGPQSYCGECVNGDNRCNGGLQTCVAGMWSTPVDCTATASDWSCFDPTPGSGSDAYCGLCLKTAIVCNVDNRDQCNVDGTGFTTLESCSFGCQPAGCCSAPTCGTRFCGQSNANACGRSINCGNCGGGPTKCCDTLCCSPISCCLSPGECGACS